jgi:hypothetical protein
MFRRDSGEWTNSTRDRYPKRNDDAASNIYANAGAALAVVARGKQACLAGSKKYFSGFAAHVR